MVEPLTAGSLLSKLCALTSAGPFDIPYFQEVSLASACATHLQVGRSSQSGRAVGKDAEGSEECLHAKRLSFRASCLKAAARGQVGK